MPIAKVQMPDGRIGRFEVPEGTTPEQVMEFAASVEQPTPQEMPKPSMGESAARGFVQGGTLGFGDEAMGAIGGAYAKLMRPDLFEGQGVGDMYRAGRDEARAQESAAQEANPWTYGLSQVAGGATAIPIRTLTPMSEATRLGRIANVGATGAAYGAAGGLGSSEADITKGDIGGAALDTAIGSGMGAALGAGVQSLIEAPGAAKAATKWALGINPQKIAEVEKAGLPVNLPSVSDSAPVKTLANISAELPGGGAMRESMDSAYKQADEVLKGLGYTGTTTPTLAGSTVHNAFQRWQETGKARFKAVDDKLKAMVPDTAQADIRTLPSKIFEMSKAPGLTARQIEENQSLPAIQELIKLAKDADNGVISFGALKQARTNIGQLLNQGLVKTQDDRLASQAYDLLSETMKGAVKQNAGNKGLKAFDMRNKLWHDFAEENKGFVAKLQEKLGDTPEDIYNKMTSGDKVGASTASRVMMKLNPVERDAVRDAIIFQKGGGDGFTIQKWLSAYDNMAPEAKRTFFMGKPELQKAHDELMAGLKNYKDVGKFGNPSRSGIINAVLSLIGGGAGAAGVISGIPTAAAGAATAYGANKVFSKMMSSPKFVKWLAESVKSPEMITQKISKIQVRKTNLDRLFMDEIGSVPPAHHYPKKEKFYWPENIPDDVLEKADEFKKIAHSIEDLFYKYDDDLTVITTQSRASPSTYIEFINDTNGKSYKIRISDHKPTRSSEFVDFNIYPAKDKPEDLLDIIKDAVEKTGFKWK